METPTECASKDCLMAPTHEAFLVLRSRFKPKVAAPAKTGMAFCAGCALDVKLDDILDDDSWETICRGFEKAGKLRPDRELAELDMIPMEVR